MSGDVAEAVLPLFGVMLAGYAAGRAGLFGPAASEALNRFVFSVSLPALIFVSLARLSPAAFFDWPFIGTLMGGMAAMFALSVLIGARVFGHGRADAALHALASMFSSTGYIGLPLLITLFGEAAIAPGLFGAVVTGAVFLPLTLLLIATESGGSAKGVASALRDVALSPIVLAAAAGLVVSAVGVGPPAVVASFCDLLGAAFAPAALFSVGVFFVNCAVRGDRVEAAWLIAAKLVAHPLITWALGVWIFGLSDLTLTIAVLLAALPTGVPVFVVAHQVGRFADRASAVVVVSTALSVCTLLAARALLG